MRVDTDLNFQDLVKVLESTQNPKQVSIPMGWRQGRTAYGGLTLGLSYSAVCQSFPNLPPLRSAMINFIGPVTSDPAFKTELLRQGRNVTTLKVDVLCDAALVATTVFTFGAKRISTLTADLPAPDAPLPRTCERFTPKAAAEFVPAFFHKFETRLIAGHRPVSGAEDGYIRVWSRHYDAASHGAGLGSFLTLSDVLPPAAMPLFKTMGPVSSVNFMLNILVDNPMTQDGWWHVETKLTAAQGGYASQIMRFWNTDGVLVAEGMQSVAIFV